MYVTYVMRASESRQRGRGFDSCGGTTLSIGQLVHARCASVTKQGADTLGLAESNGSLYGPVYD